MKKIPLEVYGPDYIIQIYSGITIGRVLDGELLYTYVLNPTQLFTEPVD